MQKGTNGWEEWLGSVDGFKISLCERRMEEKIPTRIFSTANTWRKTTTEKIVSLTIALPISGELCNALSCLVKDVKERSARQRRNYSKYLQN